MSDRLLIDAELIRLRDENATLREEVFQLREALLPTTTYPPSWRLSPREEQLLSALRAASPRLLSTERAMTAIYAGSDDPPEQRIIWVYLSHLRRKLEMTGRGIVIETVPCRGYRLPPESCARLDAAVEADLTFDGRAA